MKFKTSISGQKDGEFSVRGEKLTDLIGEISFTEGIFLVLKGKKPSEKEKQLLDAVLVSAIVHGLEAPSSFVPRVIASTGNSITAGLAAGVLAIGEYHGGAIENAMKLLLSGKSADKIIEGALANGERLPGFGHKIYKDADPRAAALLKYLKSLNIKSKYADLALEIEAELKNKTGKKLPLNIDGAMAVALCELGFDPLLGKAFFALARFPGMMANIEEELKNEKPYRRLDDGEVEYAG